MTPYPARIFTVEEAQSLLETMREVLTEVREHAALLVTCTDRLQILELLWGDGVRSDSNPDHAEYEQILVQALAARGRVDSLVREEILARGIRLPAGGIEHGLIDFPTTLDGRTVYLCWQLGESGIEHWHETDSGFAGRQPLTPDVRRRMAR